jgi:hypothetical protein
MVGDIEGGSMKITEKRIAVWKLLGVSKKMAQEASSFGQQLLFRRVHKGVMDYYLGRSKLIEFVVPDEYVREILR